jgi:hypothetical protein
MISQDPPAQTIGEIELEEFATLYTVLKRKAAATLQQQGSSSDGGVVGKARAMVGYLEDKTGIDLNRDGVVGASGTSTSGAVGTGSDGNNPLSLSADADADAPAAAMTVAGTPKRAAPPPLAELRLAVSPPAAKASRKVVPPALTSLQPRVSERGRQPGGGGGTRGGGASKDTPESTPPPVPAHPSRFESALAKSETANQLSSQSSATVFDVETPALASTPSNLRRPPDLSDLRGVEKTRQRRRLAAKETSAI